MRAFIATENGIPRNTNCYAAWLGFEEMGYETLPYFDRDDLCEARREDVVVGGIGSCRFAMGLFGIDPPSINYPDALIPYLGRKVWKSTMGKVRAETESWPLFVKPVRDKQFTGLVIESAADLIACGPNDECTEVICSEAVDFRAEWRCFVRYGEILDVRPYKGDWRLRLDANVVESAVSEFRGAPAGYGIDFGVTSDGRTLLVEVNDGYALGGYGLQHNLYARLLCARWSEIMGVDDELAYIGRHF